MIEVYRAFHVIHISDDNVVYQPMQIGYFNHMYFGLERAEDFDVFMQEQSQNMEKSLYCTLSLHVLANLMRTTKFQELDDFIQRVTASSGHWQQDGLIQDIIAVLQHNKVVALRENHVRFNIDIITTIQYPCFEPISFEPVTETKPKSSVVPSIWTDMEAEVPSYSDQDFASLDSEDLNFFIHANPQDVILDDLESQDFDGLWQWTDVCRFQNGRALCVIS